MNTTCRAVAVFACALLAACSGDSDNNGRTVASTPAGKPASFISCGSFTTQAEAQAYYDAYRIASLDADGNGKACEFLNDDDDVDAESLAVAPVASAPAGIWRGATSSGRTLLGVIVEDGRYWFRYSAPDEPARTAGALVGAGTAQRGGFHAEDGRDLSFTAPLLAQTNLSASYRDRESLSGTLTYPMSGDAITFTTAPIAPDPDGRTLAGAWTGTSGAAGRTHFASVSIAASGEIRGVEASGCSFSGTARAGSIFHEIALVFAGTACANQAASGIGFIDPTDRRLQIITFDARTTNGFVFSASASRGP